MKFAIFTRHCNLRTKFYNEMYTSFARIHKSCLFVTTINIKSLTPPLPQAPHLLAMSNHAHYDIGKPNLDPHTVVITLMSGVTGQEITVWDHVLFQLDTPPTSDDEWALGLADFRPSTVIIDLNGTNPEILKRTIPETNCTESWTTYMS